MEKFCKLFESEKDGQILVKIERSEGGGPEVRFYAQPPHLGVYSLAHTYSDDDAGWDKAEQVFADMDFIGAWASIRPIFLMAAEAEAEDANNAT